MPSNMSGNSTVTSMKSAEHCTSMSGDSGESAALEPRTKVTPVSSLVSSKNGDRPLSPPSSRFSSAAGSVGTSGTAVASDSYSDDEFYLLRKGKLTCVFR